MFFTERTGKAVTKLCGYDFRLFEAPGALALGDAGDGEHCFFLSRELSGEYLTAGRPADYSLKENRAENSENGVL